jgi:hypothetical protein
MINFGPAPVVKFITLKTVGVLPGVVHLKRVVLKGATVKDVFRSLDILFDEDYEILVNGNKEDEDCQLRDGDSVLYVRKN